MRGGQRAADALPAVSVLVVFCLLSLGKLHDPGRLSVVEWFALTLLFAGVVVASARRLRRSGFQPAQPWFQSDLSFGATLICTGYVAVALAGPIAFPAVLLLTAFWVGFLPRVAAATLLGVALVFEGVVSLKADEGGWIRFGIDAAFLLCFAVLHHVLLSGRVKLARIAEETAIKNRLTEVEERARTFRLVSSGNRESDPQLELKDQEKWLVASVQEVDGAVGTALEVAEVALQTHTCAAFLLSSDDRFLKLYDCRSESDKVTRQRFPAGEGILGSVLKRKVAVRMHSPAGLKGVSYYEGNGPDVKSLLVCPIIDEGGSIRGLLVADRTEGGEFSEADERVLGSVAAQLLRAMEVERVMTYIRKSRDEKDKFFHAIEELNRAVSPEEVFPAVLEATRQLGSLEFCAVTLVSEVEGRRVHRIARMTGVTAPGRESKDGGVEGYSFADNTGLVANVVRYGASLPGRDLGAMDKQVIFDNDIQVRGLAALKIFPLTSGNRILGTLVVGSRNRGAMDQEVLRMIEVIALQAAQAVQRAQLYEQMETMATTDGLTGLLNHRTLQSRADEILAQARRYNRKCSVLLTDIDHFKSVNDTYGHPAGDRVLKGVAQVIKRKARDTDLVARYGGEEFALLMPETDAEGARVIAERIREAVQNEVFASELGPIKVTLSIGIGTFPDHSLEKKGLIDLTDQCLYLAKRQGRNRVIGVDQLRGGKPRAADAA